MWPPSPEMWRVRPMAGDAGRVISTLARLAVIATKVWSQGKHGFEREHDGQYSDHHWAGATTTKWYASTEPVATVETDTTVAKYLQGILVDFRGFKPNSHSVERFEHEDRLH